MLLPWRCLGPAQPLCRGTASRLSVQNLLQVLQQPPPLGGAVHLLLLCWSLLMETKLLTCQVWIISYYYSLYFVFSVNGWTEMDHNWVGSRFLDSTRSSGWSCKSWLWYLQGLSESVGRLLQDAPHHAPPLPLLRQLHLKLIPLRSAPAPLCRQSGPVQSENRTQLFHYWGQLFSAAVQQHHLFTDPFNKLENYCSYFSNSNSKWIITLQKHKI